MELEMKNNSIGKDLLECTLFGALSWALGMMAFSSAEILTNAFLDL